jgi:mannose-6-phosphate isomerase
VHPSVPLIEVTHPYKRERLFDNPHFRVWRLQAEVPFPVGAANEPRILVCLEGNGSLDHEGVRFTMQRGTVMLLPAVVGACRFHPECPTMLLDVAGPVPS